MNKKQTANTIKEIIKRAKTVREIINWRSELTCLKSDEKWNYRARFIIGYFNNRGFSVFEPAYKWNEEYETMYHNAYVLWNNKGQEIIDELSLKTNRNMKDKDGEPVDWEQCIEDQNDISFLDDEELE